MKNILFSLLLLASVTMRASAADAHAAWLTDLPQAQAQAAKENKMVLVNFTGSDWCPACKLLDKTVLSTMPFADYSKSNLVLVIIDSPVEKELPAALQKSNDALKEKYKIEGFPTVIVFGSDGKQLLRDDGFKGESANEYVSKLKKLAMAKVSSPKTAGI